MRRTAAAFVAVLMLAGCGTRMNEERIEAADGFGGGSSAGSAGSASSRDLGLADRVPAPAAAASQPGAGGAGASGVPAAVPAAGSTAGRATGPSAPPRAAGATQTKTADVPVRCTAALAPVVVGQTAPTSGIIGAATANIRSGLALWARAVNARGGLACHPVQVVQMDDGADPARVTTNLTDMVRNKKAVAIVAASVPTTFAAAKQFAERNKIPFVGGDLIEPGWFASPYLFPQGGTPFAAYAGAIKEAAAVAKAKRVGLIYCVEAGACGQINENFEAMVSSAGLEFVTKKLTSITAPDYTAECQAMKNAEVEVVFLAMEGASDSRAARSCRALGYEPAVAVGAISVSAEVSNDQNLRAMGLFLGTGNAPFVSSDTPGGREFRAAYDAYAPGSSIDQNSIYAWTSGKLLEAAIAGVAAQATGPLTTQLVLEGLWTIKAETLGGLAPGITFAKEARPKVSDCYYALAIDENGYSAPIGSKLTCLRGLPLGA